MPETVEVQVYQFAELAEDVQEKVLEKFRDYEVNDDFWYEGLAEWFVEEKARPAGFEVDPRNVFFSGFGSQGDGASFTGSVDVEKFIRAHKLGNKFRAVLYALTTGELEMHVEINRDTYFSNHYVHSNTMNYDWEFHWESRSDTAGDLAREERAEEHAEQLVRAWIFGEAQELADDYYSTLETEYRYRTSDEVVKEAIEGNEYRFTADGRIFS